MRARVRVRPVLTADGVCRTAVYNPTKLDITELIRTQQWDVLRFRHAKGRKESGARWWSPWRNRWMNSWGPHLVARPAGRRRHI